MTIEQGWRLSAKRKRNQSVELDQWNEKFSKTFPPLLSLRTVKSALLVCFSTIRARLTD